MIGFHLAGLVAMLLFLGTGANEDPSRLWIFYWPVVMVGGIWFLYVLLRIFGAVLAPRRW